MTNCPNCGAVVDPAADRCAYCDTPYPFALQPVIKIDANGITFCLQQQVERGLMTPNEARRRLGLREV